MTVYFGDKEVGIVIPVEAGGGELEVVNRTGDKVNSGDKVWINKLGQVAGTSYVLGQQANTSYAFIMTPNGEYAYDRYYQYKLNSDGFVQIGNNNIEAQLYQAAPVYMKNGFISNPFFSSSYNTIVIGGDVNYSVSNWQSPIASTDGFFVNYNSSGSVLYKLNLATGETEKEYTSDASNIFKIYNNSGNYCNMFIIGDKVYNTAARTSQYSSTANKIFTLNHDTSTYVQSGDFYIVNDAGVTFKDTFYLGKTADNKYLFFRSGTVSGSLYILKNEGGEVFTCLNKNTCPANIAPYYYGGDIAGTGAVRAYWQEEGGVLCLHFVSTTSAYVRVLKYNEETQDFDIVDVDFPSPDSGLPYVSGRSNMSVSIASDLSRMLVCWMYGNTSWSDDWPTVYMLKSIEGLSANKFDLSLISEESLTGFAAEDAESGELFKVRTTLS